MEANKQRIDKQRHSRCAAATIVCYNEVITVPFFVLRVSLGVPQYSALTCSSVVKALTYSSGACPGVVEALTSVAAFEPVATELTRVASE